MKIPDPHIGDWKDGKPHGCQITSDAVFIDGEPIPGHIAPDGIRVVGGGQINGELTLNTVTVTPLVGAIEIDDDTVTKVEVYLPRSTEDE